MQPVQSKRIFQEHGVRYTDRRHAVYAGLCNTTSHPTAEELKYLVSDAGCDISTATIYNTLDLFCRQGLVRRLLMPAGGDRYDADLNEHLHLRLEDTGEVLDVPLDLAETLLKELDHNVIEQIEARMGVGIERLGVHLVGHRAADE